MIVPPIKSSDLLRLGESLSSHRRGSGRVHKGLDLFAPAGSPVLSPVEGRVLRVVNGTAGRRQAQQHAGWFIDVAGSDPDLPNASGIPLVFRLLHLDPDVGTRFQGGERVKAGQQIGRVGARGTSGVLHAQPHIHFEIARGDYDQRRREESGDGYGERIDPLKVLPSTYVQRGLAMSDDFNFRGLGDDLLSLGAGIADIAATASGAGIAVPAINAGTTLLKKDIVDKYVPGTSPAPKGSVGPAAPSPSGASDKAASVLASKGWSDAEVKQLLQGPPRPGPTPSYAPQGKAAAPIQSNYEEALAALVKLGWTPAQAKDLIAAHPQAQQTYQNFAAAKEESPEYRLAQLQAVKAQSPEYVDSQFQRSRDDSPDRVLAQHETMRRS